MLFKSKLRLLPLPVLLMCSAVDAQPVRPRSPAEVDRIIEAVDRNILSSKQDKLLIPQSVYYRAIFMHMHNNAPANIPAEDMKLIYQLPSHSSTQFAQKNGIKGVRVI